MKKSAKTTLAGTLNQLLFSPKGKLEGLLLVVKAERIQVSMEPDSLDAAALQKAIGKRVELRCIADRSPKTKDGAHPVYSLVTLVSIAGKSLATARNDRGVTKIKGVVAALHYARHGQPNGVILKSGEFIHMRPHGMKQCELSLGDSVSVQGERRTTVLGTPLIEARRVNHCRID